MNSEKYIGLDVHQATIVVAVLDSSGKLVMESILETEAATILQFFAGLRGTLSVGQACSELEGGRGVHHRGRRSTQREECQQQRSCEGDSLLRGQEGCS